MSQNKFSPIAIISIILALSFGIALYLRIYFPYDHIFSGDWIKFSSIDASYHMRLVDNLLHHFPQHITFDPYTLYPHGQTVSWPPFFDWLLAGVIWVISLGSPRPYIIDVVGVYFPAVLGALTVIPVFFIGKELFNRWVGVLSAGLLAILPGEFLSRSTLGFTDHHVAETLFTATTFLFLILAIKSARQRQLTFNQLKGKRRSTTIRPLFYTLLAGISLAIYLLTWVGGLLLIFIIFVYFIIQFIIDHLRRRNTDYLVIISTLSLVLVSVISLPLLPKMAWLSQLYLPSLVIVIFTPLVLAVISHLFIKTRVKLVYYPLTIFALGLAGLVIFYIIDPYTLESILDKFGIFTQSGAALTIEEIQPLLLTNGNFSLSVAWSYFTTSFFLSFIAICILIYHIIKHGKADKTLLVIWSLAMLAATLGQRRFSYYLAVNLAILTSYLSWQILEFSFFKRITATPSGEAKMKKKKHKPKKPPRLDGMSIKHISAALGIAAIFFLSFFPNISPAVDLAKQPPFLYDDTWYKALSWLKENTTEPFGDSDAYYEIYEPPPQGEDYNYPESAYGVMSWWDYGHWITRIAHRIPIANPFQYGAKVAARFFTAEDETFASQIIDTTDSKYVIIDYATAVTKFHAMANFASSDRSEFYDYYYQPIGGSLVPVQLFYPEYFQSLASRLYNFNGAAVTTVNPIVITYEQKVSRESEPYKEITSLKSFDSYEEAKAYTANIKSGNYRIGSRRPHISPVPLNALEHFQLIYSSEDSLIHSETGTEQSVKIFEYIE
ncbi:oligosaccharyl transferase, archaeosortase A system-associated [Chloroflexota bacterium]